MLTGLTELRLTNCPNVTTEGLRAIKTLASLSALNLSFSPSLATAGLRAVSSLSTLTHLHLTECRTLTRTSSYTCRPRSIGPLTTNVLCFALVTPIYACTTSCAIQRAIVRLNPPSDGDATRV